MMIWRMPRIKLIVASVDILGLNIQVHFEMHGQPLHGSNVVCGVQLCETRLREVKVSWDFRKLAKIYWFEIRRAWKWVLQYETIVNLTWKPQDLNQRKRISTNRPGNGPEKLDAQSTVDTYRGALIIIVLETAFRVGYTRFNNKRQFRFGVGERIKR